jgi:hypothetical protein
MLHRAYFVKLGANHEIQLAQLARFGYFPIILSFCAELDALYQPSYSVTVGLAGEHCPSLETSAPHCSASNVATLASQA